MKAWLWTAVDKKVYEYLKNILPQFKTYEILNNLLYNLYEFGHENIYYKKDKKPY